MASKFWNGYQWRRISDAEARLRRARGQEVIDGELPERAPAPPVPPPVNKLEDVLPPATGGSGSGGGGGGGAGGGTVTIDRAPVLAPDEPVPTGIAVLEAIASAAFTPTPAARATARPNEPLELTDDELEELTKPES